MSFVTLPTPPWRLLHESFLQLRWIPLSCNFYVRTCVNFTPINKIEAMYAWSRVALKLKVRVVQLVLSQRKYAFTFRSDPSYFSSILLRTCILRAYTCNNLRHSGNPSLQYTPKLLVCNHVTRRPC